MNINGNINSSGNGGIFTAIAGGAETFQLGYQNGLLKLAAKISDEQNGEGMATCGALLFVNSVQENRGFTHAIGPGGLGNRSSAPGFAK